jgi:hypothetical protein
MCEIVRTVCGRAAIVGNPSDMYGGSVVLVAIPEHATAVLTPQEWMEVRTGADEAQPRRRRR